MACLSSCIYAIKNLSDESLPNNNSNNHSPNSLKTPNPIRLKKASTTPPRTKRNLRPRQPTVIQIERAIGAGRFRDTDPRNLEEEKDVNFDSFLLNFPDKFEQPLQKKLRQSGEWMIDQSETRFRMAGKKILLASVTWMLPIWTLSLLVASGAIKLPFSTPFLDQLLM